MSNVAADTHAARSELDELPGAPSRLDEREPKLARTVGLVGLFFVLFAILMTVWNWAHLTYEWKERGWPLNVRFSMTMISLWCLLGGGSMVFHAFQDRDLSVRRAYGFLAYAFLMFGTVITALSLVTLWLTGLPNRPEWLDPSVVAGIVAGLLGVVVTACSVAPLVIATEGEAFTWQQVLLYPVRLVQRWIDGVKTNSRVQQVTVTGLFATAVFLTAGLLMRELNLLPYGLGALAVGFLFMLPFGLNEREPIWRHAGVNLLGLLGALAVLLTLGTSVTDLFGLPQGVVPYGAVAVFLGFPFLCGFIALNGTDSDTGYRTSRALAYAGLALFLIALVRSLTPLIARTWMDKTEIEPYLLPAGFFLMLIGGLYALLGATLASDNRLLVMMRRELGAFFISPIGCAVLAAMAAMAWLSFYFFIRMLSPADERFGQGAQLVAEEPIIREYVLEFIPLFCLIVLVPALTMRLFSEENRSGTLDVLLSAPVTETQVVLSKFIAVWIFNLLAWSLWAVYPMALRYIGNEPFDYRPLLSFYLGMGCMTANFLAMGLFISSLTRSQIISFLITFAMMLVLTILVLPLFMAMRDPATSTTQREALGFIAYYYHLMEFVQGRVHLRFVLFHLACCAFWLFLTVKVLEARKWR